MALRLRKRAYRTSKPRVRRHPLELSFKNIGGYESVKQEIRDAIVLPMRHPDLYQRLNIRAPKGILLWGPPGVGKTLFARTIAAECKATFYHMKSADIMSEWFGVSERRIRHLFQKASRSKPGIIFFDELENLAPNRQAIAIEDGRSSILSSLLAEIDGFEPLKEVTIIGATNIPNRLDPALLRPGRFDKLVYIPSPNKEERREILKIHLAGKPSGDLNIEVLVERTKMFTGADIEFLVNTATTSWLKQFVENKKEPLSMKYFDTALASMRPTLRSEDMRYYEYLRSTYERTTQAKTHLEYAPTYYG
jgi:transitional endoplasmic reticulum ATPase